MFGLGKKKEEKKEETSVEIGKEPSTAEPTSAPDEIDVTIHPTDQNETKKEEEEIPPLTYKELKALKKSNYEKIAPKFNKIFVLQNKRTGQIVEIRAASPFHACNIIGWKKNKVKLLEQKVAEHETETQASNESKR